MNPLVELYDLSFKTIGREELHGSEFKKEYTLSKTSFDALVFLDNIKKNAGRHLFFINTEEDARNLYQDLLILDPDGPYSFLEPSFTIKNKGLERARSRQIVRHQVVESFRNNTSAIIFAYPSSLVENILINISPDLKREIRTGQELRLNDWINFLEETEYERTNYVYEHGQYAIRGNILDIYSYAYEHPLRIELFDIEVEEIREFDIESQLSLLLRKEAVISPSPSFIARSRKTEKQHFFQLLRSEDNLWVEQQFFQKLNWELSQTINQLHEDMEDISIDSHLPDFHCLPKRIDLLHREGTTSHFVQSTPIIHKNFNKLHQVLCQLNKDEYSVFIQSEDENQHQRYRTIFHDLGQDIAFREITHEFSKGFIDSKHKVAVFTTHEIFARRKREIQTSRTNVSAQTQLLKSIKELVPGDYVTHIDHGVGRFSGLEKLEVGGHIQEAVRLIYANNDILYVHINSIHKISKYVGKEGTEPRMHRLGSDTWENTKRKTKKKIKDIAEDLIKLYAKRKASRGFAFSPDTYLQLELESSFEYEDTPDQAKATQDVKIDMEKEIPMDRLICGDVGFGKTEVAIRAAFKAVADSKQVAVLVPTTLLAFQHDNTFKRRLEGLPCNVEFINRFKSTKEKNDILKRLEAGKVDILIGTHAIVGKSVKFKDLGLLIIDEEQKFGVQVKEKLKEFKLNVDTLTLTATPIPRTLQFSLLGARDYSLIQTPPPNRQPVYTELTVFDPDYLKEIIQNEVGRGGQVFFVHNKVKDLFQMKEMLQAILPNIDIAMAHGQLEGEVIEQTLIDFIAKKYDLLLSTNIIESGIDISNVNTIIINNAHQFGLSDLHQLRGRVGRSDRKAYCYLLSPPYCTLTNEAKQRLSAMEQNAELGSGFQIAMRDLDLRGAGNLLGGEQSGFISDIGYDTFMKILDEAITELKEGDYKELYADDRKETVYVKECQIETDYDMYIPDKYITGSQERLNVYGELNQIKSEKEMISYLAKLKDVYGKLPAQIQDICDAIRLKWIATQLGIERIIIKSGKMRCYLIQSQESSFFQSDIFGNILTYLAQYPVGSSMKQTNQHIILEFSTFKNCIEAKDKLEHILTFSKKNI
ncbi:MAG: transcription-repair coupling factor [Chitinophagales bacterium]|jgi:transcription-repair coupling factor (superfamily II helicase)|nr:transcription-repair coupling factor [Sphingobacteriales bacterium]